MSDHSTQAHLASRTTHVTVAPGVELECGYEYVDDCAILISARVTDKWPGRLCPIAMGPDLADWLVDSQREQIEQAIFQQHQE